MFVIFLSKGDAFVAPARKVLGPEPMPRHFNHAVVVLGESILETASCSATPLQVGSDQPFTKADNKTVMYRTRGDATSNTSTTYELYRKREKEKMQVELRPATEEELRKIAEIAIGRDVLLITRRHSSGSALAVVYVDREKRLVTPKVTKYAKSLYATEGNAPEDHKTSESDAPEEHKTSKSDEQSVLSNATEANAPDKHEALDTKFKDGVSFDKLGDVLILVAIETMLDITPEQTKALVAAIQQL